MQLFRPFAALMPHRPEDNAPATLYALVRSIGARVTKIGVWEMLHQHPDSVSLLALSEALSTWHIENTALQLASIEQFRELPTPFIAHLRERNGKFALVDSVRAERLTWFDTTKGWRSESLDSFGKKWSGAVLLAEADENSGEVDYQQRRAKERLQTARQLLLGTGGMVLLAFACLQVASHNSSVLWGLFVTKICGTVASTLLLATMFDRYNPLVTRICQATSKANCQTLLESPGAKIGGWLSWAEIGFMYFAGGLSLLVFNTDVKSSIVTLTIMSALAFPYVFYSVYYQWKIARIWCVLCLIVQLLLSIEFVLTITQQINFIFPTLTLSNSLKYVVIFTVPTILFVLVKPWLESKYTLKNTNAQLRIFKFDSNIFRTRLYQQPMLKSLPPISSILLGKKDALHTITVVTNPYCEPCKKVHRELEGVLENNSNVNANIVCIAHDGPDGKVFNASRILYYAMHNFKNRSARDLLKKWYEDSEDDYNSWKQLGKNSEFRKYDDTIIEQNLWRISESINHTPSIYINGFYLPDDYKLSDLIWVLAEEVVSSKEKIL